MSKLFLNTGAVSSGVHTGRLLCPARREGRNKHCFCLSVRLSVCPPVAYIANTSRTQRPSVRIPVSEVKRSNVTCACSWCESSSTFVYQVCAPYLQNGKAYELQTWYTNGDDDSHQLQAPWPSRSNTVKLLIQAGSQIEAGSLIQAWSRLGATWWYDVVSDVIIA